MAKAFSKRHEVVVMSPNIGVMAMKLGQLGIKCVDKFEEADRYFINHLPCFAMLPKGLKNVVYTSHSKIYDEERFPENVKRVAVSKEIADFYGGGIEVINQPVDFERFKRKPVNDKLTNILYLSHPDYSCALPVIREACEGYNLITLDKPVFEIENLIYQADLVITIGRGCYESLACGRNVISADYRAGWMDGVKGGGMITEGNFEYLLETNLSGRGAPIEFAVDSLRKELEKYDSKRVIDMGRFDSEKISLKYEQISGSVS